MSALRDRVYETLKRRIVEVELRPGERLVERDLAAELDVSRIPLREALRLLSAEGLVVIVPNRGALVSPFTPADVRDLFDVRESLEVLAARLAAERAGADGLARLHACLERARAAVRRDDRRETVAANAEFHSEIVRVSGNALLGTLMQPLDARLRRLFRLTSDRDPARQCAEHEELYAAIAGGDADRAAACAFRHVADGREPTLALAERWTADIDPVKVTHTRRRRTVTQKPPAVRGPAPRP
ncbi:GntR family transcriptional regulator [Streptosporangium roseum]|uniref:Transcriptional regulators-like protein n=1 Tax=Streptosporangium roseum (strain ATCC 12428 / DSM 43021 / JCM 3005 / KCTC 9067 / NCIMB 10171 / NRRL 2505 / NI 9100) TaxID=479432 RepID=D2BBQ9_STRRD|nr:GntR family transcriptional regulator [Streptosporangium roseum]ACZ86128.1 Transcriptional regulators-like protein [Streptosporangium roseum DSM 43021]